MDITNYKCNFDAVMKSSVKVISTKMKQIGSFGLIMLFLSVATAQLLHIHTEAHFEQKNGYGGKEQTRLVNKCSICDYYHHSHNQQMLLGYPTTLTSIYPLAITLNTHILTGAYAAALQIISNKGPPGS